MKRILAALALGLALLAGVVLLRAAALPSRQVEAAPAAALVVDSKALAERLALAIRFRTVSHQDRTKLDPQEFRELHRYLAAAPLGRLIDPVDVANAAIFLASDAARNITGQTLVVDGGAGL